ncbi:serine/threonine-protein phosphatase 7 long form [Dorcoceras hygrometricum]|uniref:Serine/threonine-protein phosphatase 7 long form n=1 Tax=Dorcoceras hygrometricum TaxID=472368 RepID=A0A2Z7BH15_9LAMI|nr:serine/threonine-protein phosphatase 7 long form [Dorcoceras hygrometricum]
MGYIHWCLTIVQPVKERYINQLVKPAGRMLSVRSLISQIYQPTGWELTGVEQSWSLEPTQLQERTEQAQLQTKRGADIEAAQKEYQLEDENKEAGEEKERAL